MSEDSGDECDVEGNWYYNRLVFEVRSQTRELVYSTFDGVTKRGQVLLREIALKRELGHLVVETTAKVTGKVLTPDDQKRLQEEAARQVA